MNTLFIGHQLIELDSVNSTNTFAIELIKQQWVNEGMVIWAKEQTQGRGQRGNQWYTQPNTNLTFSVILKPSVLPLHLQFELNKIVSLAVADLLKLLLPSGIQPFIAIKWPNDIYVFDKKIAGILIETNIRSETITHAVVGIGLNINQTTFDSEAGNPTSLKLLTAKDFNLKTVLYLLFPFIEARYLQLITNKYELINNNYTTLLYWLNTWHFFRHKKEIRKGMITGITVNGLLNIRFENNTTQQFTFQEIAYIS